LKTVAAIPILAPYVSRLPRPSAAARRFDPNFGLAHEALRALSEGVISSRELLETTYSRINKYNPGLNAFLTLMEEQARERGRLADQDRAAGKIWGPLHGLPIVIKDAFETAGVRTTSGSKMLEKHVPKEDATAVARLKKAGAIVVAKPTCPSLPETCNRTMKLRARRTTRGIPGERREVRRGEGRHVSRPEWAFWNWAATSAVRSALRATSVASTATNPP